MAAYGDYNVFDPQAISGGNMGSDEGDGLSWAYTRRPLRVKTEKQRIKTFTWKPRKRLNLQLSNASKSGRAQDFWGNDDKLYYLLGDIVFRADDLRAKQLIPLDTQTGMPLFDNPIPLTRALAYLLFHPHITADKNTVQKLVDMGFTNAERAILEKIYAASKLEFDTGKFPNKITLPHRLILVRQPGLASRTEPKVSEAQRRQRARFVARYGKGGQGIMREAAAEYSKLLEAKRQYEPEETRRGSRLVPKKRLTSELPKKKLKKRPARAPRRQITEKIIAPLEQSAVQAEVPLPSDVLVGQWMSENGPVGEFKMPVVRGRVRGGNYGGPLFKSYGSGYGDGVRVVFKR